MSRPLKDECGNFYQGYLDAATGNSVEELLSIHPETIKKGILEIPNEKADYSYGPGKWTIKQMLQHMIDTERVFSYRALRISRNDATPMAGFDENQYADHAPVAHRSIEELKKELLLLREASDLMIGSFSEAQLNNRGIASNASITLRAVCFIIYGHNLHHLRILKERYIVK
ncbi:MAG: DinB family protein [Bacteroidetes bacterium]|nr:DinB family protein [Bacteroidota bacterium]